MDVGSDVFDRSRWLWSGAVERHFAKFDHVDVVETFGCLAHRKK